MSKHPVDVEDSLAYFVYRSSRLLRVHLLSVLARGSHDVSPEQWFILNKLSLENGQNQTALGEQIFSDRPNVSRMVASLEKRDFITRKPSPTDAREKLLFLTPRGARVAEQIAQLVQRERKRTFQGLSKNELEAAIQTLQKLEQNVLNIIGS